MTAYGDDSKYHAIVEGEFVCSAPTDAKCRNHPTCECENWCCCEPPGEGHVDGDHCCMTTTRTGQECWIEPWIEAVGLIDEYCPNEEYSGEPAFPDRPVTCEWDDGITWSYATPSAPALDDRAECAVFGCNMPPLEDGKCIRCGDGPGRGPDMCPTGCGRKKHRGHLMCRPCWSSVSTASQDAVMRSWRSWRRNHGQHELLGQYRDASLLAVREVTG